MRPEVTAVAKEIVDSGGHGARGRDRRIVATTRSLAMVEEVERRYGRIDILVNNAGIFSTLEMRPFDQIPLDEWERVLRVNVTGPFLCSRAVLPAMRRAQMGPHHPHGVRGRDDGPAELSALHRIERRARRHDRIDGARTWARLASP